MYQSRNQTNLVTGNRYLPPLSLQWYKDHGFVCTGMRCPPLYSRVFSKHVMAAVCVWPTSALLSQNMLISSGAPGRLCVTKCLCSICSPSTGTHTHMQKVTTILFIGEPPAHPYAIWSSVYIPLKGENYVVESECNWFVHCIIQCSYGLGIGASRTHTHTLNR